MFPYLSFTFKLLPHLKQIYHILLDTILDETFFTCRLLLKLLPQVLHRIELDKFAVDVVKVFKVDERGRNMQLLLDHKECDI